MQYRFKPHILNNNNKVIELGQVYSDSSQVFVVLLFIIMVRRHTHFPFLFFLSIYSIGVSIGGHALRVSDMICTC